MAKKKAKKAVKIPSGLKPLRDLALHSPYTMGYLSLMARRKQLKVKKIGRVWYSSVADIKEFEEKMKKQKQERNDQLRQSYLEKAKEEKVKISVMSDQKVNKILDEVQAETREVPEKPAPLIYSGDSIFDEVQRELGDILQEIREKERKLRHDYLVHRGDILDKGMDADLDHEKKLTEDLSGKLIDNMGRLLRTANDIHNHNEKVVKNGRKDVDFGVVLDDHDHDHLLGNYHKDNFLSVPYSYFPFEDRKQLARRQAVSFHNKILLIVSGILVFVAVLLTILILFD